MIRLCELPGRRPRRSYSILLAVAALFILFQQASDLGLRNAVAEEVSEKGAHGFHPGETCAPRQRVEKLMADNPLLTHIWREHRSYPYSDRAARLIHQGRTTEAVNVYDKYLKADPDDHLMRWDRLVLLSNASEPEKVVSAASRFLSRVKGFGPALIIRGFALKKLGRREEAEADFSAALRDDALSAGERRSVRRELLSLAYGRNDYPQAIKLCETLLDNKPGSVDLLEFHAVLLERTGRFEDAERQWATIMKVSREKGRLRRAFLARTALLQKFGKFKDALSVLFLAGDNGLFSTPDTPKAQKEMYCLSMAAIAEKTGKEEVASEAVEKIFIRGMSFRCRIALARLRVLAGKPGKAVAMFSDPSCPVSSGNVEDLRSILDQCFLLAKKGFPAHALEIIDKVLPAVKARASRKNRNRGDKKRLVRYLEVRAEIAWEAGRFEEAERTMADLLKLSYNPRLQAEYAEILLRTGKHLKAFSIMLRLAESSSSNAERCSWYEKAGNAAFANGRLGPAMDAYLQALSAADRPDVRIKASETAWQLGRYDQVIKLLEALILPDGGEGNSMRSSKQKLQARLCTAYRYKGAYDKAMSCFERALEFRPDEVPLLLEAAHVAGLAGALERKVLYLRRLYSLEPAPEAALDIGRLYMHMGLHEQAGAWFRRACWLRKSHETSMALGYYLLERGDNDTARTVFEQNIERHPLTGLQREQAYSALAAALSKGGRYADAARAWHEAYVSRGNIMLNICRIEALRKSGELDAARSALEAVPREGLGGESRLMWYDTAAELYLQAGESERGLNALQRAIEIEPTSARLYRLSDALVAANRPSEADRAIRRALEISPFDPAGLRRRAHIQSSLGNKHAAAALFETLRNKEKDDYMIDSELGFLYAQMFENASAAEALRRSVDKALSANRPDPANHEKIIRDLLVIRGQAAELERNYDLTFADSIRFHGGSTAGIGPASEEWLSSGYGIVEAGFRPPGIGYRNGRIFSLFGRVLWSNEPGSINPDDEPVQAGFGLRYKPFRSSNLWISSEGLFAVDNRSSENVLLRASHSYTQPSIFLYLPPEKNDFMNSVPYVHLYTDIGKLLLHEHQWLFTGEARLGKAFGVSGRIMLASFTYCWADGSFSGRKDMFQTELGIGISAQFLYGFDKHLGFRRVVEVLARGGHDIYNSEREEDLRGMIGIRFSFF